MPRQSFLSSFLPRLRRGQANSLARRMTKLEHIMSKLTDEIAEIKAAVEANLSNQQAAITDAVTKAKAAWDADNQAEHDAAMASLEAIKSELTPAVVTAPPAADPAAPSS